MRSSYDQDSEGLLPKEGLLGFNSTSYRDERTLQAWWTSLRERKPWLSNTKTLITTTLALSLSNLLTIAAVLLLLSRPPRCTAVPAVNYPPSGIAPPLAHLAEDPVPRLLNTTFYDDGGWYRKHDSVEADEMWIEYDQSEAGFIMIPKDQARLADIDPNRHAYIDRPDLGMVGYIAIPEAMHQMHCVNTLRMNLWYNIEHTRKNCKQCPLKPPYAQLHVDHCLDIIRKRIECTADLGLVPFMWVGTEGRITGDVARMHTCSNYENVRKFVADNAVPQPEAGVLKKPEGAPYAETYT